MERVGEIIRRVRNLSEFQSLRTFSRQIGISYEGLRKIEAGLILPGDDTIWRILLLPGLPQDVADQMIFAWEQQKDRRNLVRLPHTRARPAKSKIFRTTRRVVAQLMLFLRDCGLRVSMRDRKRLMIQMARLIEEEIYGDRSPLFAEESADRLPR